MSSWFSWVKVVRGVLALTACALLYRLVVSLVVFIADVPVFVLLGTESLQEVKRMARNSMLMILI